MRVTKFRIRNYKSILDSGYCWLSSDLTILAGKNESGKTAILEALRDFDFEEKVAEGALHVETEAHPSVELWFLYSDEEEEYCFASLADDAVRAEIRRSGVCITKDYHDRYHLQASVKTILDQSWLLSVPVEELFETVKSLSGGLLTKIKPPVSKANPEKHLRNLESFASRAAILANSSETNSRLIRKRCHCSRAS